MAEPVPDFPPEPEPAAVTVTDPDPKSRPPLPAARCPGSAPGTGTPQSFPLPSVQVRECAGSSVAGRRSGTGREPGHRLPPLHHRLRRHRPRGGDAHVRNLIRRFVEVGVSGYHIED